MNAAKHFTATVSLLPSGKYLHTVLRDGQVYDTCTRSKPADSANLQAWSAPEGWAKDFNGAVVANIADAHIAIRYGKTIPAGRRIEYGVCVGSVPFVEA